MTTCTLPSRGATSWANSMHVMPSCRNRRWQSMRGTASWVDGRTPADDKPLTTSSGIGQRPSLTASAIFCTAFGVRESGTLPGFGYRSRRLLPTVATRRRRSSRHSSIPRFPIPTPVDATLRRNRDLPAATPSLGSACPSLHCEAGGQVSRQRISFAGPHSSVPVRPGPTFINGAVVLHRRR